jgi:aspartate carbamoyltransferase catalytic subunit
MYDVHVNYVSPPSLAIPADLKQEMRKSGLQQLEFTQLSPELMARTDVLYVTRIQKERFDNAQEYESVKNSFCITPVTLLNAKPSMIIMHPLPRVNEIDAEVDLDPRAAYFRQMKYGLYVRMALLALVLAK